MLAVLAAPPDDVGMPEPLLADTGYFIAANVTACVDACIEPLIAMQRGEPHPPLLDRLTEPAPLVEDVDTVAKMAHKLKARSGYADCGLRKQTVEPVFGM